MLESSDGRKMRMPNFHFRRWRRRMGSRIGRTGSLLADGVADGTGSRGGRTGTGDGHC